MQAQVNCLVNEPAANIVSGSTGIPSSRVRLPYPLASTISPSRAMASESPAYPRSRTWALTYSSMASSANVLGGSACMCVGSWRTLTGSSSARRVMIRIVAVISCVLEWCCICGSGSKKARRLGIWLIEVEILPGDMDDRIGTARGTR